MSFTPLNVTDDVEYSIERGGFVIQSRRHYTKPFTLSEDGVFTIIWYVNDYAGNVKSDSFEIKIDTITPTTTCDHQTSTEWHDDDVSIKLSTSDDGNSQIITYYSVNGDTFQQIPPNGRVQITTEGENVLEYYSIDNAGNKEIIKSVRIIIDKTDPVVTIPQYSGTVVPIYFDAFEVTSGVAFYEINIYNKSGSKNWGFTVYSSPMFLTLYSGEYDINITATDNAGHTHTSLTHTIFVSSELNPVTNEPLYSDIDEIKNEINDNQDELKGDLDGGLNLLGILVFICILMVALIFVFVIRSMVMMKTSVKE